MNASRDFLKHQSLVQAWSRLNRNPTFQERMKAMEPRMHLIKESGVADYLENPTRYNMAKILFKGVFRWLRESTWTIVSGFSTATESIATPILTASSQGLKKSLVLTHERRGRSSEGRWQRKLHLMPLTSRAMAKSSTFLARQ